MEKLPGGTAGVKCPPVSGSPSVSARMMMNMSPPYLASVVRLVTSAPHFTPTMLKVAVTTIATAASRCEYMSYGATRGS